MLMSLLCPCLPAPLVCALAAGVWVQHGVPGAVRTEGWLLQAPIPVWCWGLAVGLLPWVLPVTMLWLSVSTSLVLADPCPSASRHVP